jgi:hypothetical protein
MLSYREEIQEAIDAITTPREGESALDRAERITVEMIDVGGRVVRTFDAENRDKDLADLKEELELETFKVVGKVFASRPFIAASLKASLPVVVGMGVQYAADNSSGPLDFTQRYVAPFFSRLRRIGERGEAAFSVDL